MNVNEAECHELSNCQGGYELKFQSRPCNQGQNGLEKGQFKVTTFQCLGHWSTNFPGKQMAIFKSEKDYKCAVSITLRFLIRVRGLSGCSTFLFVIKFCLI